MASRIGTTVRPGAGAASEGASVTKWGSDELRTICSKTARSSCTMNRECGKCRSHASRQKPMPSKSRKVSPSSSAALTPARSASACPSGRATDRFSTMSRHERAPGGAAGRRAMPRSSPPSRMPACTCASASIWEVRTSPGKRSTMRAVSRHSGAGATVPTRRARVRRATSSRAARMARSSRRIWRACSRATRPASLSTRRRPGRSKSGWPSSASSRASERDRAGCDRCRALAAALMVPWRAMASSCLSCSSSTLRLPAHSLPRSCSICMSRSGIGILQRRNPGEDSCMERNIPPRSQPCGPSP